MSDEQIEEMMDSVEPEPSEKDLDSDDSLIDPDYVPDELQLQLNNAIAGMQEGETSHAFLADIDLSAMDFDAMIIENPPAASSFIEIASPESLSSEDSVPIQSMPIIFDDVPSTSAAATSAEAQPSTSAAATATPPAGKRAPFKKKRVRSPLPTIEATGPSFTPNDGGLIGNGKSIMIVFK